MIRVTLPAHLQTLAGTHEEVLVDAGERPTIASLLAALETAYPVLQGTIRDHGTCKRRDFVRFFACAEDVSLEPSETALPDAVVAGREPFMIIGAIAGG